MKRILAAFCLFLLALPLSAGEPDTTFVQRTVRFVTDVVDRFNALPPVRIFKARDTTFYSPPPGDWTVTMRGNVLGSRMWGTGKSDGQVYRTHLTSRYVMAPSVSVGYKGVSVGYSFNPWERKHQDVRYDLSAYSNMAGIDATYRRISSFRGYVTADGERLGEVSENEVTQQLLSANAFCVFNYKHFSFPGSISQSYVQHRSSGSLIAGISYSRSSTEAPAGLAAAPVMQVEASIVAVGAGYGYVVALPARWQVMAALLPKFVVFDNRSIRLDYDASGDRHHVRYDLGRTFRTPEGTLNGYFAVVHWFGSRWFTGVTASVDGFSIGHHDTFRLTQYRWETHLNVGVRL